MPSDLTREHLRKMKLVDMGDVIVERDALNIARRVNEYDENLRVQYLERGLEVGEPPFRLLERCKDGLDRIVFSFWELNEEVLNRIFRADTVRNNILTNLDTANAIAKANEVQRYKDKQDETKDIVAHVIKTKKSKYTVNDPETNRQLTIYDDRPAEVKEL